MYLDKTVRRN